MADIATLEANIETAQADLKAIIENQLASYPPEDPTAWNTLTVEQKVAEYDRKNQAEAKVEAAKKLLRAEQDRRAAFIGSREQAKREHDALWQAKENADFNADYVPMQSEIDDILNQ